MVALIPRNLLVNPDLKPGTVVYLKSRPRPMSARHWCPRCGIERTGDRLDKPCRCFRLRRTRGKR